MRFPALIALLLASPAAAGGFYLQEQSPRAIGRAFAGEAAIADSAATLWYNPAGMTRLPGANFEAGGSLLFVDSRQENRGTTIAYPGGTIVPVSGGDGGNPFDQPVIVPAAYGAFQLGQSRLWFGLGFSAPFGLKVEYDDGWFGRYDSTSSELYTFNLQPSLAYKLTDQISIGAGFDAQRMTATLANAIPNLSPTLPDANLRIYGQDMAFGWNVGVLADFGLVRLGAHYRSHINHELRGTATLSGLLGPVAGGNGVTYGIAPISTPDMATGAGVVDLGALRLLGSVTWTNWSRFQSITVEANGAPFLESEQNYKDTWTGSLGGEYDLSRSLTLRAGAMYDQTPTVDEFRTTRVPDGNRWWASAGATWQMNPTFGLSVSYAHVWVTAEPINRIDPLFAGTPAQTVVNTRSLNTGSANILAASVSARF